MEEKYIEEVYERYSKVIQRICYLQLGSVSDADDVLQETLVKFFTSGKSFIDEEHEKAWLIRVAINKCKDMRKSFWRKNIQPITETNAVFEMSEQMEVVEAIIGLPAKYKNVIFLYYYEGYSASEIATILEVKESTVYSNIDRARKKLKKSLGEDMYEETF